MRAYAVCCALGLLVACGRPGDIPDDPPPRPSSQVADLPPADFLGAEVMITMDGKLHSYCFPLDGLLTWFREQDVNQQTWTQLDEGTWRLDGVDTGRKEHTVWVFERRDDGVELTGYQDSEPEFAFRDPREILALYDPRLGYKRAAYVHETYERITDCPSPFL